MRVDRPTIEPREARPLANALASGVATANVSQTNFASRLQQQRQKACTQPRESSKANESEARQASNKKVAEECAKSASTLEESTPGEIVPNFNAVLSLLSAHAEANGAAAVATGGAARAMRRWNDAASASPCIEVMHEGTGTSFVLSRQDGVWLLSLKDCPSMGAADVESLVKDLRSQFAERGLGEVDVIA